MEMVMLSYVCSITYTFLLCGTVGLSCAQVMSLACF